MLIPKEDVLLFKTITNPKVNVQLRSISIFLKSSQIKTTTSRLSYELGENGEKKVNGTWDIINKNGQNTGKHGNFNSLRDVNLICHLLLP